MIWENVQEIFQNGHKQRLWNSSGTVGLLQCDTYLFTAQLSVTFTMRQENILLSKPICSYDLPSLSLRSPSHPPHFGRARVACVNIIQDPKEKRHPFAGEYTDVVQMLGLNSIFPNRGKNVHVRKDNVVNGDLRASVWPLPGCVTRHSQPLLLPWALRGQLPMGGRHMGGPQS